MKKVLSHVFQFIKHLFLRLRLVITLSVGKEKENEQEIPDGIEESSERED